MVDVYIILRLKLDDKLNIVGISVICLHMLHLKTRRVYVGSQNMTVRVEGGHENQGSNLNLFRPNFEASLAASC